MNDIATDGLLLSVNFNPLWLLCCCLALLINNLQTPLADDRIDSCSDFRTLVTSSVFIDKSLFIEEFLKSGDKVSLITRPPGWGKSTNLDMLKTFLQAEVDRSGKPIQQAKKEDYKLFVGGLFNLGFDKKRELPALQIERSKFAMEKQGRFPVLSISFRNVSGTDYLGNVRSLRDLISGTFRRYDYLASSESKLPEEELNQFNLYRNGTFNETELLYSLKFLIRTISDHFGQNVYVLIDDYDIPVNRLYASMVEEYRMNYKNYPDWIIFAKVAKSKQFRTTRRLFRLILGKAFQENVAVEKALIVGTYSLPLSDPVLTGLATLSQYGMLERGPYSTHFGLTEDEAMTSLGGKLLGKSKQAVRSWYGYNYTEENERSGANETITLYSPWSIRNFAANKNKFEHFWVDLLNEHRSTGGDTFADTILESEDVQLSLQMLMDGEPVQSEIRAKVIHERVADDLTVPLQAGYLNAVSFGNSKWTVNIPNEEIHELLKTRMVGWACRKLNRTREDFADLAADITGNRIEEFQARLQRYLSDCFIPVKSEDSVNVIYTGILRGIIYSFGEDYLVESFRNHESGHKVTAIIMSKKKKLTNAVIIEYRIINETETNMDSVAEEALLQIDYRLDSTIKHRFSYINQILKLVLVFFEKKVSVRYKLETS